MAERELLVRIVGDDRDLQRALRGTSRGIDNIDRRTASFGKNIKTALGAAGVALGASAVFAALRRSVSAASDLNEQITKSRQVFGDSAAEIERWSRTTSTAIGISQRAALTATGTFGNLFNTVGTGQAAAAGMSQALVQLAADLASFNNANPEDVLTALRSGLIGEAEPLRRFGVLLSEARVQQEALTETGKSNVKELTNQEKTLARYHIILQDTMSAQGDFARTSEGLANQSRVLNANLADLSANIGGSLAPAVNEAVKGLNVFFKEINQASLVDQLTEKIAANAEGMTGAIPALTAYREGLASLKGESDALVIALDAVLARLNPPAPPSGGPFAIVLAQAKEAARLAAETAREADAARASSQKRFAESFKGLGLKQQKAALSAGLEDDLAVAREIERRIRRQIEIEGHTFELEELIVRARADTQSILSEMAADAERKQTDAASKREEARTKAEKKRADKAEEERAKRKRIREQEAARNKAEQFESLGLTSEGDRRTPGAGSLLARARSLQNQIKGTNLDTAKTRQELQRIVNTLRKHFKTAGRDVRQAILEMLNDIDSALSGKSKAGGGPLTKTSSLNSKKLLEGLGLSESEERELRARLSNFNSAGKGLSAIGNRPTGSFRGGDRPIVVESTTTINLDGQKVATVVTRNQQKASSRNPRQKRGPNRHQN